MRFNINLLPHFLIKTARDYPDKIAIKISGIAYSYQCILQAALLFAERLRADGSLRGDKVIISASNSLLTVVAFWGTLLADGVVVLIADDISQAKFDYIMLDSAANFIVKESSRLINFEKLKQKIYSEQDLVLSGDSILRRINLQNNELDLAAIIYTSGSTGEPKGVMLTHRNMLAATDSINQYLAHSDNDVILSALPLSFDYGLYQMIMAFSVGATLILAKNALFPAKLLCQIQTEKVTVLPAVPTLFAHLAANAQYFKYEYTSVRCVTNTGAALTSNIISQIQNLFPDVEIYSMYGLTECKRCTYLPPKDLLRKPNSIGIAIPNTELWLVDDEDNKLPHGVIGQLVIRGATVMKGYLNKPLASAQKLKTGPIAGEQVLYTGDLGELDDEGYLYFRGRMDDVLKFKGMKLSPIEHENLLSKIAAISQVAVLGIENSQQELLLILCLVLSSETVDKEKLTKEIKQILPAGQFPNHIFYLPEFPKLNNGKIDKKTLRQDISEKMFLVS